MSGWDGELYERLATLQHEVGRRFVASLESEGADRVDAEKRVLDAGCGDGVVTRLVAELPWVGEVFAFDPSPLMIRKAAESAHPSIVFAVGDVTSFTVEDRCALAVSLNALHWVQNSAAALGHLRDALLPGGHLVAQFVPAGERPSIEDAAEQVARSPEWRAHFEGMQVPFVHRSVSDWRHLAADAGFSVDSAEVTDHTWDFDSAEAFRAWCSLGFTSYTDHLPADRRARFIGEVAAEYTDVVGSDHVLRFLQLRLSAVRR